MEIILTIVVQPIKLVKNDIVYEPKKWSEWNNIKHLTDYSSDSGLGESDGFTISVLLFFLVGFLS